MLLGRSADESSVTAPISQCNGPDRDLLWETITHRVRSAFAISVASMIFL